MPIVPAERKGVVPQSRATVNAAVHFVAADAHPDVAKTYVACTRDMAAPVATQRAWAWAAAVAPSSSISRAAIARSWAMRGRGGSWVSLLVYVANTVTNP